MEESGYAGFILPIEVYFKNKVHLTVFHQQTDQNVAKVQMRLIVTVLPLLPLWPRISTPSSGRAEESSL